MESISTYLSIFIEILQMINNSSYKKQFSLTNNKSEKKSSEIEMFQNEIMNIKILSNLFYETNLDLQ